MPLSKIVAKSITDDTITATQLADNTVTANQISGSTFSTNLLHNASMIVAQRGTSSTSSGYQTCDRWTVEAANFDQLAFTQHRSGTAPDGFNRSLRVQVTTAETALASNELMYVRQVIEARDCQRLAFGTSAAKSLTLSFYVRSSLTGKYSVLFYVQDGTRSNTQSFTVDTADTWEYKTITIDGDTANGPNDDNGYGLAIHFALAAGTDYSGTPHSGWGAYTGTDDFAFSDNVNFAAQTGNFYLTGVQLQEGTVATPFIHRTFAEDLAICQRYYQKTFNYETNVGTGTTTGCVQLEANNDITGTFLQGIKFPVNMRGNPSIVTYDTVGNSNKVSTSAGNNKPKNVQHISQSGISVGEATTSTIAWFRAHYTASAEF
jgi:hypothetical protein